MKISIITINWNNNEGLKRTLESVVSQTSREYEYIVVDGASTDGSVETIVRYANHSILRWVSEPDGGIYNAMNKGIRMATGEYVMMLNSGDWFVGEGVLEALLAAFPELHGSSHTHPRVPYFDCLLRPVDWPVNQPVDSPHRLPVGLQSGSKYHILCSAHISLLLFHYQNRRKETCGLCRLKVSGCP